MKTRILSMLLLLVLFCTSVSAAAEYALTSPVEVTDPALKASLVQHGMEAVQQLFPDLTATQLANLSVSYVIESDYVVRLLSEMTPEELAQFPNVEVPGEGDACNAWSVRFIYDDMEVIGVTIEMVQATDGTLYTVPANQYWDLPGVIRQYEAGMSREDALILGQIYFAAAIREHCVQDPQKLQSIANHYGFSLLDPANFAVEAVFYSSLNGGMPDWSPRWCLSFYLPGCDEWKETRWYSVDIDAATGAMLHEYDEIFFIPKKP